MADDEQMDLKKYEEGGYEKQGGSSFWNAEKVGDVLEGVVVDVIGSGSEFGKQWMIECESATSSELESVLTPSHKVLQNRMNKVEIGDQVKIVYVKEDLPKIKGHNPTKIYEVFVKKK